MNKANRLKNYAYKMASIMLKRELWLKYNGNVAEASCYCCGLVVLYMNTFYAGRVISKHNGGNSDIDNLRPVCKNCNSSRYTNMDKYAIKYYSSTTRFGKILITNNNTDWDAIYDKISPLKK
jgi:hypothetical protein